MKKMTISKCPKCGSGCLMYKPDGSILCTVCMTKMDKEVVYVPITKRPCP